MLNLNLLEFDKKKIAGNIKFKEKFLKESISSDLSESTLKSYIQVFNAIAFMEKLFQKDVYDMSLDEYKATLQGLALPTYASLITYKSVIEKYIAFALDKKLILSNSHPSFSLKKAQLMPLLNTKKSYNRYITYKEYKNLLEKLTNYQDKVFVILLWHNLYNSKLEIIRNILVKNVKFDESKLLYIDNEEIKEEFLEDFELEIIKKSLNESTYIANNQDYELIDNDCLIKKIKGNKKLNNLIESVSWMNKRFNDQIKTTLKNSDIKMIGIAASGVVYRLMQHNDFGTRGFLTNYSKEVGMSYEHLKEVINIVEEKLRIEYKL